MLEHTMNNVLPCSFLGKTVDIKMDRPLGSKHPKFPDLIYPVNYGYIPGVLGGNAETAKLAVKAGANVLVAGSAVFKASDRRAAIEALR